ncbi:MAG TPA: protease modulator HflK [Verrucomicrobiae bacterium]|nr:protease modulator HflK [Verrucomicrobiae bacterium]
MPENTSITPKPSTPPPPDLPVDSGSQALAEALQSSFGIVKIVMAVLVIVFLASGFFKVGPNEQAIILRLGKPVGEGNKALLGPGAHWSWPYPIDDHIKVSVRSVQQAVSTTAWYATTPEQELAGTEPPAGPSLNPAVDGYALTSDENIVHTRATLTYHINDPIRFLFNFVNASNAIQNALDDALLFATAHYKVDDIITRDILGFNEAVQKRVTELVTKADLGITVDQCTVKSIPPRQQQVKDAFDSVLKAEVTRSKVLNEARSYANQVLSKASADAESRVNLAETERDQMVKDVTSRAAQFEALLPKYEQNPKLFVQQRFSETMSRVLTNVQDRILVPEGAELRYDLNRELPKPKPEEQK